MTESIGYKEYEYLCAKIAYWLLNNNKSFKKRDYYNNGVKRADLEKSILDKKGGLQNNNINEYVECAIEDNKNDLTFLPNYVVNPVGKKYYKDCYVDMAQRVSAYEVLNGKSPAIVYVQNPNNNTVSATTTTVNETYNYFVKKFGSITDFDSALRKVQSRGYAHYYDSKYSNIVCIDRMYNKYGINCTDSAQVLYKVALALGYTVQFVHVKCKGGDGHIRLRLKHSKNTGGEWIYRDPASVLSGNAITKNWCLPPAYTIAYDPSWIFTDL